MPQNKTLELKPIKETSSDFDEVERRIKELLRREIYWPALAALGSSKDALRNDVSALNEALRTGRVTFNRGQFSGKFNSEISAELKAMGARFDRFEGTWRIAKKDLPPSTYQAALSSEAAWLERVKRVDKRLAAVSPEALAEKLKVSEQFDKALWRTERGFESSIKGITIAPKITPEQRKRIADEWQNNMRLYIKDFTEQQIKELRAELFESTFNGNRYGSAVQKIQKSYGVSEGKARFLARQETALLMGKYKEIRYEQAGVKRYKWRCVAGSKNHPVRPWHKALENRIFSWSDPPITTKPGEAQRRNNPGGDYNCRCFAIPVVDFRKK